MYCKNIIVGAGMAGCTLARVLADKGEKVLVVEKRTHIAGYCYDYREDNGILVHKFGPHIFRTSSEVAWEFMSRFTDWHLYQHKVLSYVGGKLYSMPINLDTINEFTGQQLSTDEVANYLKKIAIKKETINNVKDVIETQIGSEFYEMFFKNYTFKQWGESPELLPTSIVSRIPIRSNRDDRYFTEKYQAMPQNGYTELFLKMISHPNIKLMLNTDYHEISEDITSGNLYYTGSIDRYYDFRFGKMPYRCVNFKFEKVPQKYYQPTAVVNYPNDYNFTRITDYARFYPYDANFTIIAKEFSSDNGDPSYPIPTANNIELYNQYHSLVDNKVVHFLGRLGEYKYYSMDQIVEHVLRVFG